MFRKLLLAIALLLFAAPAWGAMTVTRTRDGNFERVNISWTSAADGSQTQVILINGTILRVVTDPGATAPTDNYDLTLVDEFGLDLFTGGGANRDTANSEQFVPGLTLTDGTNPTTIPVTHWGTATVTLANAGDSKVGTIVIFIQR